MQGFNMGRYVPPDQEGTFSGNQLHGKHALDARAKKISQGILTVRFEMPYPIWCTTCPKPSIIGQGVRFNAEKKKVGNYFTSPIYSFRMKHAACGGWIEIRTDPKNTAYIVIHGARKRDLGQDKLQEGDVKILTEQERDALRKNAFAALEGKVNDTQRLAHSKRRVEELHDLSEQQWDDPYEKNKKLRRIFREGRKKREKEANIAGALKDKMSLGLELLPEHEEDARKARFVEFGTSGADAAVAKATSRPLFRIIDATSMPKSKSRPATQTRAECIAMEKTSAIAGEIRSNTRVALDPFLTGSGPTIHAGYRNLVGIKRKQPLGAENTTPGLTLVDYDSD